MSKVKVTIEYKGDVQEFECDVVLMGGANIEQGKDGIHRIAVRGAVMGKSDLMSLNRIYAALGNSVHENNIKCIYKTDKNEAIKSVQDIMPEVTHPDGQLSPPEITEMHKNGTLCEQCGCVIGQDVGSPRLCEVCKDV